jgi:hypothetical protein
MEEAAELGVSLAKVLRELPPRAAGQIPHTNGKTSQAWEQNQVSSSQEK